MDEIFFSDDLFSKFTWLSKREIEHESCTDRSKIMSIRKGVEIFETLMTVIKIWSWKLKEEI